MTACELLRPSSYPVMRTVPNQFPFNSWRHIFSLFWQLCLVWRSQKQMCFNAHCELLYLSCAVSDRLLLLTEWAMICSKTKRTCCCGCLGVPPVHVWCGIYIYICVCVCVCFHTFLGQKCTDFAEKKTQRKTFVTCIKCSCLWKVIFKKAINYKIENEMKILLIWILR